MSTIIKYIKNSDFSIHNIPFGVFSSKIENNNKLRCCTRLGDYIIDLEYLEKKKIFNRSYMKDLNKNIFDKPNLNDFMGLGKPYWSEVRSTLIDFLKNEENKKYLNEFAIEANNVTMHLPANIGDFTAFNSSKNHAHNIGSMVRDPNNPIKENWYSLPVAFHGRSSSVVLSGNSIKRPLGQVQSQNNISKLQLSQKWDFELEIGSFIGTGNNLGEPINIKNAEENIFGLVLLNDISCRDLQKWEYQPLGPFTSKNLGTVISPWIVTLEALEPFRVKLKNQNPEPLDYLKDPNLSSYDINFDINIKTENNEEENLSKSNFKYLYWSMAQQLTHHTISGCNMRPGDLMGSGTISGKTIDEYACFMELSWNGTKPVKTKGGERLFLNDNDEIIFYGSAVKNDMRVGFGECKVKIIPNNYI